MKTAIIIQARMGSTRLPGKVLKEVCGKPLLEIQIERLKKVRLHPKIIVATTLESADEPIVELCRRIRIPSFRGSERDVLSRYYECAKVISADFIIRVTGDCPLIDPQIVSQVVKGFHSTHGCAYAANVIERTYPRGMDVEMFSFHALESAHREAKDLYDREHVTPFIRNHSSRFPFFSLRAQEDLQHHRWTVDTPEDFELIRRIIEALYPKDPHFKMQDILAVLAGHPDWSKLNAHVAQKEA